MASHPFSSRFFLGGFKVIIIKNISFVLYLIEFGVFPQMDAKVVKMSFVLDLVPHS